MATNSLQPTQVQVANSESHSNASISASAVARFRQAQSQFEVAKEQAVRDLSSNPNLTVQEVTNAVMGIQDMHRRVNNFTNNIAQMGNPSITPSDASIMRAMRAEGQTDAQIGTLYNTNPTKVNRMINGS